MQRPLETLIYRAPELGTVQRPLNVGGIGVELPADSFSKHMDAAAFDFPTEFIGEFRHPLTGTSLPQAGNILPAPPGEQPLPPSIADVPPNAEAGSQPLSEGIFDTTLPSVEIADIDVDANSPVALPLVADDQPNINNIGKADPIIGEADPIPQGLAEDIAIAGLFAAKPEPAIGPVPVTPRPKNYQLTDRLNNSHSRNRREASQPAFLKLQGNSEDTANRVTQELAKLTMPTETHAAKPPLSGASPPAYMTAATLPLNGGNLASPVPATSLVTAVDTPVFDPAWAGAIQDRILWMAGKNIQSAEIRLNPAELGPLRVQISVDDNSTHISFSAAHALTRDALEIALPRLKDMLAENGMSLTDASVSDEGIADGRHDSNRSGPSDIAMGDEESTQAVSDLLPNRAATKTPLGLVDTYV